MLRRGWPLTYCLGLLARFHEELGATLLMKQFLVVVRLLILATTGVQSVAKHYPQIPTNIHIPPHASTNLDARPGALSQHCPSRGSEVCQGVSPCPSSVSHANTFSQSSACLHDHTSLTPADRKIAKIPFRAPSSCTHARAIECRMRVPKGKHGNEDTRMGE